MTKSFEYPLPGVPHVKATLPKRRRKSKFDQATAERLGVSLEELLRARDRDLPADLLATFTQRSEVLLWALLP